MSRLASSVPLDTVHEGPFEANSVVGSVVVARISGIEVNCREVGVVPHPKQHSV